MGSDWQVVSFPLILPWRQEFWTLPLYFPDLKVGVLPGWPPQMPYQGMALPPEAEVHPQDLKYLRPGELRQWQAFAEYRRAQGEEEDLSRAIRHFGAAVMEDQRPAPDIWTLAWQLEKMQADQEARMHLVDKEQDWLKEILAPEPWEEKTSFGPVPGVGEMVDPDLAKLRYHLWLQIMEPYLQDPWVPLLLGRTSRSLFLTLRGWPEWTEIKQVRISLPGCRDASELARALGENGLPPWRRDFRSILAGLLDAAAVSQDLTPQATALQDFITNEVAAHWPWPEIWNWDLEVWSRDGETPVLCWSSAGAGILPG